MQASLRPLLLVAALACAGPASAQQQAPAPGPAAPSPATSPSPSPAPATPEPSGPPKVEQDCPTCPKLVVLPNGLGFGQYPVTKGEYAAYAKEAKIKTQPGCYRNKGTSWFKDEKASWRDPGFPQTDAHPVVCVSWEDATAYAEWLSRKTKKTYRLATKEEHLEAAAPAGEFWWGASADELCANANVGDAAYVKATKDPRPAPACNDGFAYTSPVGSFRPNRNGIYDLNGNVWQWTNSCMKGDCTNAVFRGGGFNDTDVSTFKIESSWGDRIVVRSFALGFRIVRETAN
ncbi:formylglycine-generating enzyme family protein [uncultured Alsobacter sp.]|uniref:formylglycine-generating enzyme family protein n=1 Tax=uncultured Alsobacter sp. TaxID=1748258 RepID=UPI00345C8DAA